MKKLIIYDHIGTKLLEQDVFVEGQDFHWSPSRPVAYWLGEIMIVDKEPEPEPVLFTPEPEMVFEPEEIVEEVKHEPETTGGEGGGDAGAGEAKQPESTEKLPEQPTRDATSKGDKRHRKAKTP